MQYQVPQFIEVEDKIIGPLTLKQFLYLAFAGAILFVLWFLFNFYIWIIVALPIAALAAAFAFLKINDRPFVYFFLAIVKYFNKPKLYIFSSAPREALKEQMPKKEAIKTETPEITDKKITPSKLKELALKLDVGANRPNND